MIGRGYDASRQYLRENIEIRESIFVEITQKIKEQNA
jgi:hypothetical protein